MHIVLAICIPSILLTTFALFLAGVSTYLIAFVFVVQCLVSSFAVIYSHNKSQQQIKTLSNLLESMISGDYSLRGRLQEDLAFQQLLDLVNNLAATLAQHKLEAKQSRQLLEKIMEQMDAMIFAINPQGAIVLANQSAQRLLLPATGQSTSLSAKAQPLIAQILAADTGLITFDQEQLRGEHFLYRESFLSDGQSHQLYLITSAQRLLMEKERQAWQSILRVLSHEMNNSLTPIIAVSQSIEKRLNNEASPPDRASMREGINLIKDRAAALSSFIASYSQLSQLPKPVKQELDLDALIINIASMFELDLDISDNGHLARPINIYADKHQIEQVMINLLKNALEAMAHLDEKSVTLSYAYDRKAFRIVIQDEGGGISNTENLFVPFYSTKPQGSGIGLALCRQIMFNHDGQLDLQNRIDKTGAKAILTFPLTAIRSDTQELST